MQPSILRRSVPLTFAAIALTLSPAAHASRMVVRLLAQGAQLEGPVTVTVSSDEADPVEVEMNDAGETPDVTAGDGVWSSTGEIAGDTVTVKVAAGGQTWDAGSVTWTDTELARDLELSFTDGDMVASAATALPQPSGGVVPLGDGETPDGGPSVSTVQDGSPPTADGASGPVGGGAPNGSPAAAAGGPPGAPGSSLPPTEPPGQSQSGGDDGSAQLFIIFGLGLLGLVLLGWMWFSANRRGRGGVPLPLAQPGLLGPGTPPLSGGDSIWRSAPADLPALAAGLVARIARERPVLLATADGLTVPPVHGGPVYPADFLEVDPIADLADALEEQLGRPIAVVLVGDAAATAHVGLRGELAESTALVLIGTTESAVEPRAVRCAPDGDVWRLSAGDQQVAVRASAFGFEPAPPGPAA